MTLLWKPGYTTGVPELDEEHRLIFDQLNALEQMIARGVSKGPEVEDHLKRIGAHVTRHFAHEETCMEVARCPMALKNKQQHERFMASYVEFLTRYRTDKTLDVLREFHAAAEQWVLEHIAFVDIHLRSCVEQPGD
jgi:hemerythrin-like metal-binding protein